MFKLFGKRNTETEDLVTEPIESVKPTKDILNVKEICKSLGFSDSDMLLNMGFNRQIYGMPKTIGSLASIKEEGNYYIFCYGDGSNTYLPKHHCAVRVFSQVSLMDTSNIEDFTNKHFQVFLYYYIYAIMYSMGIRSSYSIDQTVITIKSQKGTSIVNFCMSGTEDYISYDYVLRTTKVKGATSKSFKYLQVFESLVNMLDEQWEINSSLTLATRVKETLKLNKQQGTTLKDKVLDWKSFYMQYPIEIRPFALNSLDYVMWMYKLSGIKKVFWT